MSRSTLAVLALVSLAARPALAMDVEVSFSGSVTEVVAFDFSTGGTPPLAGEIGGSVALGLLAVAGLGFRPARS